MKTRLLSPLELRPGITARNRVWLAPLTNMQSHADGSASDDEERFLRMRAEGGFGLVETCAAYVTQDGKAWPGELGVHDDAMLPGLARIAASIRAGGALGSVQLFHGGLRADPAVSGVPTLSASALEGAREADEADLTRIVAAFAAAAARCAKAGFEALEIHGAHGYLLSQFVSTHYNQRGDGWGGSLENRARLMRETTRAVRAAAPGLALAVRISPEDFGQTKGVDLDESLQLARWLVDDGADIIHASLWRAANPTAKRPDAHPTTLFREALGARAKLVVAGSIWTREDAEAQLDRGADAVALGRAAIANHDWPLRMERGDDIARPPVSAQHLREQGLSAGFVGYMGKWKGFVQESAS